MNIFSQRVSWLFLSAVFGCVSWANGNPVAEQEFERDPLLLPKTISVKSLCGYLAKSPFWRMSPYATGFMAVSRQELGVFLNIPSVDDCSAVVIVDRLPDEEEPFVTIHIPRTRQIVRGNGTLDAGYKSLFTITLGRYTRMEFSCESDHPDCDGDVRIARYLLRQFVQGGDSSRIDSAVDKEICFMEKRADYLGVPVFQFISNSPVVPGRAFGFVNFGRFGTLEIICVGNEDKTVNNLNKSFRTREIIGGSLCNNRRYYYSSELCIDGDGKWHDMNVQLKFSPIDTDEVQVFATNVLVQTWRR